jgi:uncharacterized metal-binding protein
VSSHRGSSLIFLGFSVIAFIISYGIVYLIAAAVLGSFFSLDLPDMDSDWQDMNDTMESQVRWLLPVAMMVGIFMLVLKVLMVASVRGRD